SCVPRARRSSNWSGEIPGANTTTPGTGGFRVLVFIGRKKRRPGAVTLRAVCRRHFFLGLEGGLGAAFGGAFGAGREAGRGAVIRGVGAGRGRAAGADDLGVVTTLGAGPDPLTADADFGTARAAAGREDEGGAPAVRPLPPRGAGLERGAYRGAGRGAGVYRGAGV